MSDAGACSRNNEILLKFLIARKLSKGSGTLVKVEEHTVKRSEGNGER